MSTSMWDTLAMSEDRISSGGTPKVLYQARCPVCGGLRRASEFNREIEPVTGSDLIGQTFSGRSRIQTVDRVSYAEDTLEVAAVRRRWIQRVRRALEALQALGGSVFRRFEGIALHRSLNLARTESRAGPAVESRYKGAESVRIE